MVIGSSLRNHGRSEDAEREGNKRPHRFRPPPGGEIYIYGVDVETPAQPLPDERFDSDEKIQRYREFVRLSLLPFDVKESLKGLLESDPGDG